MNLGVSPARTVLSEHAMHSTQSAGGRGSAISPPQPTRTSPGRGQVPNLVQENRGHPGDSPCTGLGEESPP